MGGGDPLSFCVHSLCATIAEWNSHWVIRKKEGGCTETLPSLVLFDVWGGGTGVWEYLCLYVLFSFFMARVSEGAGFY